MNLCECGCGQATNIGKHFVLGHHMRTPDGRIHAAENGRKGRGRVIPEPVRRRMGQTKKGNTYWLGKKHSPETRAKMSASAKLVDHSKALAAAIASNIGRKASPVTRQRMSVARKGKPNKRRGVALSQGVRAKISRALIGNTYKRGYQDPPEVRAKKRAARIGDKNPAWIDGRTYVPYSREFQERIRYEIKRRDHYTCQDCGRRESELTTRLNVHHIDTDRQNNDPSNLVSLCDSCHRKRHNEINCKRKAITLTLS